MSDEEAEDVTFQEYAKLYLDRETRKGMVGELQAHDGDTVVFTEWRFEHAFFTSRHKTTRQYNKGKFDRDRACRIRWIGWLIKGTISSVEYCHIPDRNRRDPSGRIMVKRLYVLWEERYLIWLEPRFTGGWWFSSAYVESRGWNYIRKLIRGCVRKKVSRD